MSETDYLAERNALEREIESLSSHEEGETLRAWKFLAHLAAIWEAASEKERCERVVVDTGTKDVVALKPREAFLPLFATHPHLTHKDGLIYPSLCSDSFRGSDWIRIGDNYLAGFRSWLELRAR